MKKLLSICLVFLCLAHGGSIFAHYDNGDIQKIWETMDERTLSVIESMADNPFPNPAEGSSADYGIGMVCYALTNLYLNQNLETCQQYIQHVNEHFNFQVPHTGDFKTYFQMSIMLRIWFWFSDESLYWPGRLTAETQNAMLEYFWGYVSSNSKVEDAQLYDKEIYYLQASGNHHVIKRTMHLLANQILKEQDAYKNEKLADGFTPGEHYEAWETYWKHDIVDRGKRALEVEYAANGYYKYTMDCFMTIREFAQSSIIRDLAQKYLDVIFADIAVQTDNGLYGGARGRSTRYSDADTPVEALLFAKWFNTQSSWRIPDAKDPLTGESMAKKYGAPALPSNFHPNMGSCMISTYTPPQPVADLVLNYEERGTHEYTSRPPGRGTALPTQGWYSFEFPSRYLRYSYVTPSYVVGGYTFDRSFEYNDVMGQNRQTGIHFTTPDKQDSKLSRVFAESERNYSRGFHDLTGVAYKNTMIMQGLPEARYFDASTQSDIYICFTEDIYSTVTEEDGWVFGYVPDGTGYIAVKPSKGKIKEWKAYTEKTKGKTMGLHFTEKFAPVVMQAGSVEEYGSLANFKAQVKKTKMTWNSKYEFEYTTINGDTIKTYTNATVPKINGKTLDLEPENMIKSPFFNGVYGTGVYQLVNQNQETYTIRFAYDDADEVGPSKMFANDFISDWNGVKLRVNGSLVGGEQPPVIEGDTTLVPLRGLFERLDAEVLWDGAEKKITVNGRNTSVVMTVGSKEALVNGKTVQMGIAPQLMNERTMIPVRFVAENLGAKVKWDEENKTVVIWKGADVNE